MLNFSTTLNYVTAFSQPFDVAYETASGSLFVYYTTSAAVDQTYYNEWTGAAWQGQTLGGIDVGAETILG